MNTRPWDRERGHIHHDIFQRNSANVDQLRIDLLRILGHFFLLAERSKGREWIYICRKGLVCVYVFLSIHGVILFDDNGGVLGVLSGLTGSSRLRYRE